MSDNIYFFRQDQGYTDAEKEDRLLKEHFVDPGYEVVSDYLAEYEVSNSTFSSKKSKIIREWQDILPYSEYSSFLNSLFNNYGKKGDKANLQAFETSSIAYDQTLENTKENAHPDTARTELINNDVRDSLKQVKERSDSVLDLEFILRGVSATGPPSASQGDDVEGNGSGSAVSVEVRVYMNLEYILISNSRPVEEDDHTLIIRALNSWMDGTVGTGFSLPQ